MLYTKKLNENTTICECVHKGIVEGDVIVIRKDDDGFFCTVIYKDHNKCALHIKADTENTTITIEKEYLMFENKKGTEVETTKKLRF